MKNKRIIIGGGGTGGHIFPAISIAKAIKKLHPDTEILFVGAKDKIEMQKVPEAGFKIIGLPVAGFQRKLSVKNISFFIKLYKSMRKAARIIEEFKPQIAVGVGGYASGPILRAAASKGIPTVLQEQNSYAGLTNKILARKASKIFIAYEGMEKYFSAEKLVLSGNPVRPDLINSQIDSEEAFKSFGLIKDQPVILILGGSLGAGTINQSVLKAIDTFPDEVQILWQCGKYYYDKLKSEVDKRNKINVKLHAFISDMDKAFYVADIIISRAGAGTISELQVVGKAAILVPSPNVAEDHQTKNAMALVEKSAALMVRDSEAEKELVQTSLDLLGNIGKRKELSENIKKLALPNSAKRIAEEIFELL
ncbi:MAG: undecaprenyldiphospho-muramoylpentapeptide beta-N-acetylglucosaminyltransferase [Bacteroidales bacterium]|nr:undecaprenyldiphospho-muramoylpentapeptide beta-N-acetylglucosaminyltransferase [Bacteroidales bacterium]